VFGKEGCEGNCVNRLWEGEIGRYANDGRIGEGGCTAAVDGVQTTTITIHI